MHCYKSAHFILLKTFKAVEVTGAEHEPASGPHRDQTSDSGIQELDPVNLDLEGVASKRKWALSYMAH